MFSNCRLLRAFGALLCLIACVSYAPALARGDEYAITAVSETGVDVGDIINQAPEINHRGAVLFRAENASGVEHVYLADDGSLVALTGNGQFTGISTSGPNQLNELNQVAFRGSDSGRATAQFVASGGAVTAVYGDFTGTSNFQSEPSINDAGQIAFRATHGGHSGADSVLLGDAQGSPLRVIASQGGTVLLSSAPPLVSETGKVVYVTQDYETEIRILHIAHPDNSIIDAYTAANADERILPLRWLAGDELFYSRGGMWWRQQSDGIPRQVNPATVPAGRISTLEINDSGRIAGYVDETDGPTSIFAGDEAQISRLIGWWDDVNGRRVAGVQFGRGGFNNSGQITFWANTYDPATGRDYRVGIFVATPDPNAAPDETAEIAQTDFREPALGTASYQPGPNATELGFQTVSTPSSGRDPLAAIGNIEGGPEPYLAHRAVAATTTFDPVDLSQWENPTVSMIVHFGQTIYEAGDFLRISATNGGETVTLFELQGAPDSGDFRDFDPMIYLTWPLPTGWRQATLSISTFSDSSGGSEWYEFRDITFEGVAVPEPNGLTLLALGAAAMFLGRRRSRRQESRECCRR